jgi:hypothetical protein
MTRFLALLAVALAITGFVAFTQPAPVVAQSYVQPGPGCSRNSECSDPLVCMSGRCRYQCVENRDCGAGQHCVSHGPAGGSCVIDTAGYLPPDAAYCVSTRDCTSGACGRNNQCGG